MSKRSSKNLLVFALSVCVACFVVIALTLSGSGSAGPTADFDIDHIGDYDNTQCYLSGSFDPGDADRLIIDTTGSTASIDITTSVGLSVIPGASVEVYTVTFSETNAPGDVDLLTEGYVTNDCDFEVTTDE